jgi:hypothetical protein
MNFSWRTDFYWQLRQYLRREVRAQASQQAKQNYDGRTSRLEDLPLLLPRIEKRLNPGGHQVGGNFLMTEFENNKEYRAI